MYSIKIFTDTKEEIDIRPSVLNIKAVVMTLADSCYESKAMLNEQEIDELIGALIAMKYKVFPESDHDENPANTH